MARDVEPALAVPLITYRRLLMKAMCISCSIAQQGH